ncbi:MAG: trigger factor [Gammaproteobacteria bacterium]|nr:trigger factor [Gammaproteobacteria bacterium]
MEVTVEVTQGLERRMTVSIPDNDVESQVEKRLRSIAKTARMEGFRPGKVPFKLIAKQYRGQVTDEVMGDLVQSTFGEALSKESLQPAGGPTLESRDLKDDNVFEYAVTFEVYPEIEIQNVDKIKVERPAVEIADEDIDKMIDTLRQQQVTWNEVDRASQKDDRVIVGFDGKIDDESFDGGATEGMPVVLGAGTMLSDFEDNLLGMKAGDEKTFDVAFPDDYHGAAVAGKTAQFTAKVDSVSEPVLPELDDEFVKAFGVDEGGIEKLRSDIRENMQRELDNAVRTKVKNQIMDGLLEQNEFDVPNAMVDEEIERLRQSTKEDMKRNGHNQELDLPGSMFEEQARRRIKLGLMVAELVKTNDIKPDKDKIDEEIKAVAATYEQSEAVEQAYRAKPELMQGIEAVVIENQVVDMLLDQVDLNDVEKGFYDVVQSRV